MDNNHLNVVVVYDGGPYDGRRDHADGPPSAWPEINSAPVFPDDRIGQIATYNLVKVIKVEGVEERHYKFSRLTTVEESRRRLGPARDENQ